jgi:hypothetical protein
VKTPLGVIALLTDFGLRDPYAGVMKGVILSVNRDARLIDLSHDIPPQGVLEAYFLLSNSYRYFPVGTLFVAVVDPGVGSDRAVIGVETEKYVFLAPDNGLLGFLEKDGGVKRVVKITNKKYFLQPVSNTFHGRDVFAPVAGHLSLGTDLGRMGQEIEVIRRISAPAPLFASEGVVVGEVVSVDKFGNLITNVPGERLEKADRVEIRMGRTKIDRVLRAYASAKKGELFGIVGSSGTLEISVNRGDAAEKTGAKPGDPVRVKYGRK